MASHQLIDAYLRELAGLALDTAMIAAVLLAAPTWSRPWPSPLRPASPARASHSDMPIYCSTPDQKGKTGRLNAVDDGQRRS